MQKLRLNRFFFLTLFYIFTVDSKLSGSQAVKQSDERCRRGYFLHMDELCNPKVRKPCPFENQSTATTSTTSSIKFKKLECPDGSIMLQSKCRKIVCTLGEYYRGTCLQPVCPQGLVWRRKSCQKPAYLTTIIEIDNIIVNEVVEKPFSVATVNKIAYYTSSSTETPVDTSQLLPLTVTTQKPDYSSKTTNTKYNATDQLPVGCCKVFTPRLCKLYGDKWLCFNRKYERCNSHVCKALIVFLKAPEIKYDPPLLVMPPNPKLDLCEGNSCQNNSDVVDCSGCSSLVSTACSSHCYRYVCPNNSCIFMDLYEYCSYYSGQNGCLPTDGCLWKWCPA